jgi:F-type H+-transporting ATPase subunit a
MCLNFLVLTGTLFYSYLGYFVPHGMQLYMIPALWFIELISHFVKCLSLAIRLFANIFAGHVLLHIFFTTVVDMLQITILILSTSFALIVCTLLQLLELFVSFLQALVFTLLATQYFGDINEHMKQDKVCCI